MSGRAHLPSAADLRARIFRRKPHRGQSPWRSRRPPWRRDKAFSENQQLACRVTGSQHRLASLVDPKREGGDALSENSGIGQRNPASIQPADAWTVSNKRLASGHSGGAPAQNIRSFSSAITFVTPGSVTNATMSLKH